MKHYILVHGAWEGGWAWERVAPLLVEAGHTVEVIDLPGSHGHEQPIEDITLDRYVDTVIEAINRVDGAVTLAGHSLGGTVISQTAERVPDRIERLIYVTAFLLENGGTALAAMESDEDGQMLPRLEMSADQSYAKVDESTWREVAFHDASEESILEALPRLAERQSLQPFVTPLELTESRFGSVPKTFLRSTLDRILTPTLQERMINNWPVEQIKSLDSGHFPTLSMPEHVAGSML